MIKKSGQRRNIALSLSHAAYLSSAYGVNSPVFLFNRGLLVEPGGILFAFCGI